MSNDVKIGIKAVLDDATIAASAAAMSEKLNRAAQSIAQANKVKYEPVGKGTVEDLKKIEAKFIELTRISGALRDRIKATGQGASSFAELDWGRLYEDPATRQRKMQQAFQHVAAGTAFARTTGGPQNQQDGGGGSRRSSMIDAAGKVAGDAARASGSVGGTIAGAVGHGMQHGIGAGIGFGVVDLLSKAISGTISLVKEKVDAAGQEGIGYDTLKRTLGDVNVSFNLLRSSLRSASYDVGTTFEETQKLGSDFAKLSGISKEQYKTLADEVSVGGGFGRSFGIDPSQSNQFFAQMRQFRVTETTQDSRKLALMIGEAVTKSGSTAKTDELLQAIASFTANQARNGLAAPNAVGYSGMLSGLVGSGVPGLDPHGAAALLARVNGAISGGGGAGEAGQNYMFNVLGKRNGLDPVQAMLLQQQGAFGTGRQAFGAGSLYQRFSKRFGGGTGSAGQSDETNISAILADIQKKYAGNPSLMLNATARLLGVNENQAMALHTIGPNQLGGMTGRMGRLGLDLSKMNGTGISALGAIEGGRQSDLKAQADFLLSDKKKPLSNEDAAKLRSAMAGGDQEKLKDILAELTYTRGQEETEGKKTRDSIQGVDKRLQELATGLIGPANDMRNAMVYLAGGGKKSASQINKEIAGINYNETIAPLKARRAEIDKQLEIASQFKDGVRGHKWTPAELADRKKNADALHAERDQINQQIDVAGRIRDDSYSDVGSSGHAVLPPTDKASSAMSPDMLKELAKTDKLAGLSPGTSAAQIQKESGFNSNAYNSRSGAMGMAQVMPRTLAALEKRLGRKLNPYNKQDAIIIQRELMVENKRGGQSDAVALARYNSGWDPEKWGNPETTDYLSTIERTRGNFATPMPDGAPAMSGQKDGSSKISIEGNFTLQTPNGTRAADPVTITKTVGAPRAQGSAR